MCLVVLTDHRIHELVISLFGNREISSSCESVALFCFEVLDVHSLPLSVSFIFCDGILVPVCVIYLLSDAIYIFFSFI